MAFQYQVAVDKNRNALSQDLHTFLKLYRSRDEFPTVKGYIKHLESCEYYPPSYDLFVFVGHNHKFKEIEDFIDYVVQIC